MNSYHKSIQAIYAQEVANMQKFVFPVSEIAEAIKATEKGMIQMAMAIRSIEEDMKRMANAFAEIERKMIQVARAISLENIFPTVRVIEKEMVNAKRPVDIIEATIVEEKIEVNFEERITQKVIQRLQTKNPKLIPLETGGISYRFPLTLPEKAQWQDITIRFQDGQDVTIEVNGLEESLNTSCSQMGFAKKTNGLPRKAWKMLEALSKLGMRSTWRNGLASSFTKKRKQEIKDLLCRYFGINEDPFLAYSKKEGYVLKINLIPED